MRLFLDCNITKYEIECEEDIGNKIYNFYKNIYKVELMNDSKKVVWKIRLSKKYHKNAIEWTNNINAIHIEHNLVAKVYKKDKEYWIVGDKSTWSIYKLYNDIYIYSNNINDQLLIVNTIIRQINRATHLNQGTLFLHSASFSYQNRAYILCGEKGSGKTTLLLNILLQLKDSKFISNDITLIKKNNDVLPVFSGSMIGKKTLENIGFNINSLCESKDFYYDSESSKYFFSLKVFQDIFKIQIERKSEVGKIYLLKMDLNDKGIKQKYIDRNVAIKLVEDQIIFEDKAHSDFMDLVCCDYNEYMYRARKWIKEREIELLIVGDDITLKDIIKLF